eukprot:SAG25_NODE_3873_length_942_cov_1.370546_3_plen_78_part_00
MAGLPPAPTMVARTSVALGTSSVRQMRTLPKAVPTWRCCNPTPGSCSLKLLVHGIAARALVITRGSAPRAVAGEHTL